MYLLKVNQSLSYYNSLSNTWIIFIPGLIQTSPKMLVEKPEIGNLTFVFLPLIFKYKMYDKI